MVKVESRILSALEKVFPDEELQADALVSGSALRGERYSFQIAFRMTGDEEFLCARVKVDTGFSADCSVFDVGLVPVMHPVMQDYDDNYLRTKPGLFPDPLYPHTGNWSLAVNQWRSIFVTITVPQNAKPGTYPVSVSLIRTDKEECDLCKAMLSLTLIAATLPKQTMLHTEWFHNDCISSYYNVPVFSEEHWKIIGNYIKNAVKYGVNLLLTPIITPPLDTAVGGERPTVQLVDITLSDGRYHFGFEKLDRYMALAESCGIEQFEMSHLFTQWGAMAAPRIVITENGTESCMFGWDTDSASEKYSTFLVAFLQALKKHLREKKRLDRCWFHISDEPGKAALKSYERAKQGLKGELDDCRVIDALSEYSFYEKGLIRNPVPPLDFMEEFLNRGFPHPWTYYCSGQRIAVSNRFIAMPSARNRVIGSQFYKFAIEGFLNWGFNFWYSSLSRGLIDPYCETGSGDAYPAGDAYLVYPGKDGEPVPSIREVVFFDALQDMRAMQLLESLTDRQTVLKLIDPEHSLTFTTYPKTAAEILQMREAVNRQIAALCENCSDLP